jgi:hypothetical protein
MFLGLRTAIYYVSDIANALKWLLSKIPLETSSD